MADKMDSKEMKEITDLQHKNKMEQLAYERETFRLNHSWKLEEMRIKSAEIRRDRERVANERWVSKNEYHN
jgi:hypothetical protein